MVTGRFDVEQVSDTGPVKKMNEDCGTVLCHDEGGNSVVLVAVADGVGGLTHSEVASRMAIEGIEGWWSTIDWAVVPKADEMMSGLHKAVESINENILRFNQKKSLHSGTTLTVLLLQAEGYQIFHVGDSRVYHIKNGIWGGMEQLTKDHSVLMPKEVNGNIRMKSYLTDCIGFKADFEYQRCSGIFKTKDYFLVCTDGIYKTLKSQEIIKTVRSRRHKIAQACNSLMEQAVHKGETDNMTVSVVRIIN